MDFFLTFILPVLIVGVLAALIAFFLSFLGIKLKVNQDERVERIRENLPGINCGGCGFAGCDAFAVALFKGEVKVSACKPSSTESKEKISKILGVEGEGSTAIKVACVFCNGGNLAVDKGAYQGYGDCQSAAMLAGGTKLCEVGCMGLGSCVKACQYHAMTVDKDRGVARVDPTHCITCGACFKDCPKQLIKEIPVDAKYYVACSSNCGGKKAAMQCKASCIACGLCVKACEYDAIKVKDSLARIDYEKCVACGECAKVCPQKCIIKR